MIKTFCLLQLRALARQRNDNVTMKTQWFEDEAFPLQQIKQEDFFTVFSSAIDFPPQGCRMASLFSSFNSAGFILMGLSQRQNLCKSENFKTLTN